MYELALFAGAGGGILGGKLLGWRTVCAVERDPYARAVLAARQNDGCLDPFPIWDDVRTFTKRNNAVRRLIRELRRIRDSLVISGGFPCQDISCAGKGAGLDGARSGLWAEFARIIREILPRHVFVENSPMLTSRGLGRVLGDLATMGYDARWGVLGAVHAGAPHRRLRIWIRAELANADRLAIRDESITVGWRDGARFARRDGSEEHMADANGDARHSWWASDAAQGIGGRDTHRSGVSAPAVADTPSDRRPQCDEQHDGRSIAAQIGDGLSEFGGVGTDRQPQALADSTSSGQQAEWTEAQERSRDAGASCDVSGGDSRERERERDDPNTLLDGLEGLHEGRTTTGTTYGPSTGSHPGWWIAEPDVGRVVNGLASRVDRLRCIGNGQVPAVVRLAWHCLAPETT